MPLSRRSLDDLTNEEWKAIAASRQIMASQEWVDAITGTDKIPQDVRAADPINRPAHYAEGWSNGAEVIDITENLNFNRGNAVKYLARAGAKDPAKEIEDLRKAAWYVQREIGRLEAAQ